MTPTVPAEDGAPMIADRSNRDQTLRTGDDPRGDGRERHPAGSRWEWVAAVISFLLVATAIVFLIYDAVGSPPSAPAIEITVDSVVTAGKGYLVEFTARNSSASTAAVVVVEGMFRSADGAEVETSQVTFDFLPGHSRRAAGFFFTRDPREGTLEIRPLGYARP